MLEIKISKNDYSPEHSLFKNLSFLFDGGFQGDKGNQELDNSNDNLTDLKKLIGQNHSLKMQQV